MFKKTQDLKQPAFSFPERNPQMLYEDPPPITEETTHKQDRVVSVITLQLKQ